MALNINGTTGISGVDGSASAPALQGTDSNTGINFGSDTVNINTGGVTRATVDSSGNVGIGDSTPSFPSGTGIEIYDASTPRFKLSNSTTGTGSTDGSFMYVTGSDLILENKESANTRFYTAATERMRIDSNGHLLFGQTTTSIPSGSGTVGAAIRQNGGAHFSTAGDAALNVNRNNSGDIQIFQRNGLVKGEIHINASRVAYNTESDYRLKENITTLSNGITRLKTLKPSRFNFKVDPLNTMDGFIAHELQTVVPEAVSGSKDGVDSEGEPKYQGVDTSFVVPLLTAALQEAVAKIEVLETKVAALEAG